MRTKTIKRDSKKLAEAYKLIDRLFPDISKACKNCNTCCKTYGWLLKQEAEEFSEKGYPAVEINKNLYCFDSFIRDEKDKRIFDQIPRCSFYRKGKCSIYNERPLDCRLYPIKVKFRQGKAIIGLSLGCKYISSLVEKEREQLCYNIVKFFRKAPQNIVTDYLNLMENINSISKPKRFWMNKIIEIGKEDNSWKMSK